MVYRLGGQLDGNAVRMACNVVSTYQTVIARGDMVQWWTGTNFQINSAADGTNIETLGVVEDLSENSAIATVKWFAWHGPYEATYSGTAPTLSHCIETAGAAAITVTGSTNSTLVAYNRCIATQHKSGYCAWVVR